MSERNGKWCWTRIGEATHNNKEDTYKCLSEILQILLESFLVFVFFIFENFISIVFLLLGIIYMNDCPIRESIPYSLITLGAFGLIHGITIQVIRSKCIDYNNPKDGFATLIKIILWISSMGSFFSFIWVCIAIYTVFSDVNTHRKSDDNYCNFRLYWIAFSLITICLVFCLLFFVVFCCLICTVVIAGASLADFPPTLVIIDRDTSGEPNT